MLPLALLPYIPSAIKGVSSLFSIGKGNQAARRNHRPVEQVNPLYQKNVTLAENMARQGMPQEQYNNQMQGIQRNQAGALSILGRRGGDSGSLASLLRGSNDAIGNLNAQDAMARQGNQRFAFGQRGILANQQNNVWDYNNKQRYAENAASIAQQIGSGKQNAFGSLTDATNIAMMQQGEGQDLYGDNTSFNGDGLNKFKMLFGGKIKYNQIPKI